MSTMILTFTHGGLKAYFTQMMEHVFLPVLRRMKKTENCLPPKLDVIKSKLRPVSFTCSTGMTGLKTCPCQIAKVQSDAIGRNGVPDYELFRRPNPFKSVM